MAMFLVLLAALVTAAPLQKDLTGSWSVRLSAEWTTMPDLVCQLAQKGRVLSGNCRAAGEEQGPSVEIAGKVQGSKIECQWKVPTPDGATWSFALTGTADEKRTQIKGTFAISGTNGGGGDGTFLAVRK